MSPFRTSDDCLASQGQPTPAVPGVEMAVPDPFDSTLPSQPPLHWWQRLGRNRNGAAVVPGGQQISERPLGE